MEETKRGEKMTNLTEIDEAGQYEYYSFEYAPDTYEDFIAEMVLMGY
jgi:hypothetical protein